MNHTTPDSGGTDETSNDRPLGLGDAWPVVLGSDNLNLKEHDMSEMVKIRELWYINKQKLLNRAIAAATWPFNRDTEPVSHCSEWEPDENGEFGGMIDMGYADVVMCRAFVGQCWTSTTRGDANGTVVRPASGVLDHPENWLFTEHSVLRTKFEYAKVWAQIRVDTNKGYSARDLSRYGMPLWLFDALGLDDKWQEICCGHVETWEIDMVVLKKRLMRSPRRLCKHVVLATGSPLKRLVDGVVVRDGKWRKVNRI